MLPFLLETFNKSLYINLIYQTEYANKQSKYLAKNLAGRQGSFYSFWTEFESFKKEGSIFFKVQKALIFLILMVKNIWTVSEDSGASI